MNAALNHLPAATMVPEKAWLGSGVEDRDRDRDMVLPRAARLGPGTPGVGERDRDRDLGLPRTGLLPRLQVARLLSLRRPEFLALSSSRMFMYSSADARAANSEDGDPIAKCSSNKSSISFSSPEGYSVMASESEASAMSST